MEQKKYSLHIGGRDLIFETGLLANQANGSVTVQYGDTKVLATAVMSKSASFITGYFPLMVDYEERYYAAGKIKGSRFIKREGRPSDEAVLSGRMVDRTIRPLFNDRMRNDVQIIVTVLCYDGENDPSILAMIAASAALTISDIPWRGPIGAVRVGRVKNELVLNPKSAEQKDSDLDLIIAGTEEKINMLEAGAQEVPENDLLQALSFGHETIAKISAFITDLQKKEGKEKVEPALLSGGKDFEEKVKALFVTENLSDVLFEKEKVIMAQKQAEIMKKVDALILEEFPKEDARHLTDVAHKLLEEASDAAVHEKILKNEERPDGRKLDEVRAITCAVGILPRTHGTGLFTRGETQALTVTTLGSPGDEQVIDTMKTDEKKRYIHHYNFPPFSVGEVRPMRGPGRREVGHGALAERALVPVLPSKESFPYTILLVSETLSSNGSSSMAATCGSTLSLMDAGVPITRPVSGIAMGAIIGENNEYKVLSDIQGLEDHYGDMDCKIAGTEKGITALQMDVKVDGITPEIFAKTFAQARVNRLHILEKMKSVLAAPRKDLSAYAPRIIVLKINPDKIRDVIGPGGKVINQIIAETGVSIDIEDDGSVFITSTDETSAKKATEWVENLTREVKVGEKFVGRVTRIMNFGAFVEILPSQEGLVHISELADRRVAKVEDVVKVGDTIPVIVTEIDAQGRINLSHKRTLGSTE